MARFTGIPCVHCEKPFEENDNVAVCPICGAPHHRDCYMELGHCKYEEKHAEGFEYTPGKKAKILTSTKNTLACPHCGEENGAGNVLCQACNRPLKVERTEAEPTEDTPVQTALPTEEREFHKQFTQRMFDQNASTGGALNTVYGSIYPNDNFFGVTAKEIAQFIGSGSVYYLTQFKRMKDSGVKFSLNLSAFLLNGFYFLYRKMYTIALPLLAFMFLYRLPTLAYTEELLKYQLNNLWQMPITYNVEVINYLNNYSGKMFYVLFGLLAFLSLYGNYLYLQHVLKSIHKVRRRHTAIGADYNAYLADLQKTGRTNALLVILVMLGAIAIGSLYFYYVLSHMPEYPKILEFLATASL